MRKIIIEGGNALNGEIVPQGSKNAALPILFACLVCRGISFLYNVPDIGDISVAISILKLFGARITREENTLVVDTRNVFYNEPPSELTGRIRASSYLYGACLSRFGKASVSKTGGCDFDNRPIDLHIKSALKLGAKLEWNELVANKLIGSEIDFEKVSVGATINTIIMAASAVGETVIRKGAREPHVLALIEFLRTAGAKIEINEDNYVIKGAPLHGGEYRIIPDMIELGTYFCLAPLTGGKIYSKASDCSDLTSYFEIVSSLGITVDKDEKYVFLSGSAYRWGSLVTMPYPGYPTDLAPQMAVVMGAFFGGKIEETVWLKRFGYLSALSSFGIGSLLTETSATILPSYIKSASVSAPDLRGGAACILAALSAKGRSEILCPEIIMRGYSDICEKLLKLGAKIKITE